MQQRGVMNNLTGMLKNTRLFYGIEADELERILRCLSVYKKQYLRGEYIHRYGDKIEAVGVVISGKVMVLNEDYWGNRTILTEVLPGRIFGEAFAAAAAGASYVSVIAVEDCEILFLSLHKLLSTCSECCDRHQKLIRNFVAELANKNVVLNEKIGHMSKRTTREKLLSYLSAQSRKNGGLFFEIPFNRKQLAEYLGVDRTAMSKELSKLRDEGVIEFDRRAFKINEIARGMSGYVELSD